MPKLPTTLMNESVTVSRLSGSAVNDRGLSTATWVNIETQPARVIAMGGAIETESDSRIERNQQFKMILPASSTANIKDKIIYDSINYNVRNVKTIKDRFGNDFYKELLVDSGY